MDKREVPSVKEAEGGLECENRSIKRDERGNALHDENKERGRQTCMQFTACSKSQGSADKEEERRRKGPTGHRYLWNSGPGVLKDSRKSPFSLILFPLMLPFHSPHSPNSFRSCR